jgi:hypothetical protein
VFTSFHKLPYTYPYGRSIDETTTSRNFGIISVLAFVSLGGFGSSRSRISLNRPLFWKRRTRNQKLVALQKNQLQNYQQTSAKHKKTKKYKVYTYELQSTYLG